MFFLVVILFYEYVDLLNINFVDFVIYIVSKKHAQFGTTLTLPSGAQNANNIIDEYVLKKHRKHHL